MSTLVTHIPVVLLLSKFALVRDSLLWTRLPQDVDVFGVLKFQNSLSPSWDSCFVSQKGGVDVPRSFALNHFLIFVTFSPRKKSKNKFLIFLKWIWVWSLRVISDSHWSPAKDKIGFVPNAIPHFPLKTFKLKKIYKCLYFYLICL